MRLTLLEEPVPFLTDQPLGYNPTGEWIFPTLFDTRDRLRDAPARWLLGYSPHDAPGGVCFAWADQLEGRWSEAPDNPVIANDWPAHYRLSHVASPHLIWLDEVGELACYFHGENDTTRLARSTDGRTWRYGGVAMQAHRVPGWSLDECSYARVHRHRLPGDPEARYVMFFMGKQPERGAPGGGARHLFLATSPDGLTWTPRSEPVVSPEPGWQASGPCLARLAGQLWLLHHLDIMNGPGHLYATPLDETCRPRGPSERILAAEDRPDAGGRLADPLLVDADGDQHLIWLEGPRLQGRFVRARAKFIP